MDIVGQIKDAVEGHETEVKQGIDAVGDFIDQHTGGKVSEQVDQAQDFLKKQLS